MAGPKIPWRPGRVDGFAVDATPDGRLPNAALGADHLRNVSSRLNLPNDIDVFADFWPHGVRLHHPAL